MFDQKGSSIFTDVLSPEALLGILSSKLVKYFVKSFINHGVDAQLDDVPIVMPTEDEVTRLESKVTEIVKAQKANPSYDYNAKLSELDSIVFDIYRLTDSEKREVDTWYQRRSLRSAGTRT